MKKYGKLSITGMERAQRPRWLECVTRMEEDKMTKREYRERKEENCKLNSWRPWRRDLREINK